MFEWLFSRCAARCGYVPVAVVDELRVQVSDARAEADRERGWRLASDSQVFVEHALSTAGLNESLRELHTQIAAVVGR